MKHVLLYEVPLGLFEVRVNLFMGQLLRVQYERDGHKARSGIFFPDVAAVQMRHPNAHPSLDKLGLTSEALYEVDDSPWRQAILADAVDAGYRERKRHFVFHGVDWSYDFLADAWQLLPERDGWETDPWLEDWRRLRWQG